MPNQSITDYRNSCSNSSNNNHNTDSSNDLKKIVFSTHSPSSGLGESGEHDLRKVKGDMSNGLRHVRVDVLVWELNTIFQSVVQQFRPEVQHRVKSMLRERQSECVGRVRLGVHDSEQGREQDGQHEKGKFHFRRCKLIRSWNRTNVVAKKKIFPNKTNKSQPSVAGNLEIDGDG